MSRNGISTVQLPPLPRYSSSKFSRGQQPPLQISPRECAARLCRFVSNRRTALYVAALLTCASLLMLVNHLNRMQLRHLQDKHNDFLKAEKRAVICEKNTTILSPPPPPPYPRPLPPVSFLDPALPAGHPCQRFTLPPPPADKKRTGPRPCPVCYLPVKDAVKLYPPPGVFPELVVRDLTYIRETSRGNRTGSVFGGYPKMQDRENSSKIQNSMTVHCGFASGEKPGVGSRFDIDERDRADMDKCSGVVVTSAIFGNYDVMQQPKNIHEYSRRTVCFFMFVDELTEASITRDETYLASRKVGLWRVVTMHTLPYRDSRRTGKIPKMLAHRLFPNARFSLWVDGKLELLVDPYQILERFLWRTKDTFAISKHYKRYDVFVEAEANKEGRKYNNASLEAQVRFYREEGMTPYSEAKMPIVSDVPEGCVIIREHTPVTNLFSCMWFNEVDRFTSRDQLSFGIVRDKIIAQIPWRINMFLDCERRNFVFQREHRVPPQPSSPPPPSRKEATKNTTPKKTIRKDGRSQFF